MTPRPTVLVLGGGVAALCAAEAARAQDPACAVVMLSAERHLPYSRPMLTKAPLRGFDPAPFLIHPPQWYRERDIHVHTGAQVEKLLPQENTALMANGNRWRYDACVYALGARCFVPPVPGAGLAGVFSIRTLADMAALRRRLAHTRQAVIIGGGVIGLEAALELQKAGNTVTVLELAPTLMGRQLDEASSRLLREMLEARGIATHTGVQIDRLAGTDTVEAVCLDDGTAFPAELVVFSCGVRANSGIAQDAGAKVGRAGLVVDETMRTSLPSIYACGDCAEYAGQNPALWTVAAAQGRVAGTNAASGSACYEPEPTALLLNSEGLCLCALGDTGKGEGPYEVREETPLNGPRPGFWVNQPPAAGPRSARYFYQNGRLVGGVLLGDLSPMSALKRGIEEGVL